MENDNDSDSDYEDLVLAACIELLDRPRRRERRWWVHDTLRRRSELGEFHRLIQELKLDDQRFYQYFRMGRCKFEELLTIVAPRVLHGTTNYRETISAEQRLVICLRFLNTGDSLATIASSFRIGHSTTCGIVAEVCQAIWDSLAGQVLPHPNRQQWKRHATRFAERWNFPNCVGAIDGKHVRIQAPINSGSQYFNYKGYFSIVLMAMVDADYRFTVVDVGGYGSASDGGILVDSNLGKALVAGDLHLPPPEALPGAPEMGLMPYTIVGDEAFPLRTYLLRPYPGRHQPVDKQIFNYRLSRARRIVENAFGLLAQRFRIYQRTIVLKPENVVKVVKATCCLHNFLTVAGEEGQGQVQAPQQAPPSEGQQAEGGGLAPVRQVAGNRAAQEAVRIRDTYKQYFNSPAGEVPWQYGIVCRGLP